MSKLYTFHIHVCRSDRKIIVLVRFDGGGGNFGLGLVEGRRKEKKEKKLLNL